MAPSTLGEAVTGQEAETTDCGALLETQKTNDVRISAEPIS
ncbi:MAG: hypothetical protein ACPGOV_14165 [Magnetovibrionaceae bacterium]